MKTTYEVTTDAISQTIEAETRDDAAAKFAEGEGFAARNEADLRAEIEALDGWLDIAD